MYEHLLVFKFSQTLSWRCLCKCFNET